MKVAIIIPNWNGAEKLRHNLPSVLDAAKYSQVSEVIVSDDASSDNSLEVLGKEFPKVRVLVKSKNGGFSSNVNFAVSKTDADLIVLLNSDARPSKNFLDSVLPHFEDPKVFSVGCNTGGSFATAEFKDGYFWHHQSKEIPNETHQTLWASGGSGIFRKSIWNLLGGFDTLFDPFYEEDLDIGYRARKRGFINLWEPKSKVEHYKEKGVIALNFSKDYVSRIAQRNQLIFIWKNITDPEFTVQHKIALLKRLLTHPKYFSVFLSALFKLSQINKNRQKEIRESTVSDRQILKMFSGVLY